MAVPKPPALSRATSSGDMTASTEYQTRPATGRAVAAGRHCFENGCFIGVLCADRVFHLARCVQESRIKQREGPCSVTAATSLGLQQGQGTLKGSNHLLVFEMKSVQPYVIRCA